MSLDNGGGGAEVGPHVQVAPDVAAGAHDGLRAATVKGTAWSYASFVTIRVPALVTTVVLTRLVAPRDFGVIALGLVVLTYLDALNEFGISSAVIYSADDGDVELSVAFWLSMVTGIAAALLMTASAIPLAAAFDEPRLRTVIPVLSLAFVLNSAGSVQVAVLKRRLQFRGLVPVDVARAALKAAVAISAAFAGWGVWSLVAGQLAGELAGSVAVWLKLRWRPSFVWDHTVVRRVLGYGSHIMGVGLVAALLADVDYLIVGRRLGSQQLGFYAVGFRLPELAVMGICYAVSATMFPVLTRLRRDPEAMALGLAKSLRVLALLTFPIGVGIALTSRDFVATFYGDRWAPTSRVMPFIAMYAVAFSITFVCGDVYKAVGRPGILMAMGAARFPVAVAALLLVAGHGIVWVAATQLALMSTNMVVQMVVAHRVLGIPFSLFARSTRSAIVAGAAMAVAIVTSRHAVTGFGSPARFFISIAIGSVTYVAVALTLERSLVGEVADGLRSRIAA